MLCHSAEHDSVCSCIWTSEEMQCTLTPSPCFQGCCPWVSQPALALAVCLHFLSSAPVSIWLSGRSRCRRWWDPQLDVQTLKCSRVKVLIAAFVFALWKTAVMQVWEGHPFVLTQWQDSRQCLLMLLCFQEEI